MRKYSYKLLYICMIAIVVGFLPIRVVANEESREIVVTELAYMEGSEWTSSALSNNRIIKDQNMDGNKISLFIDGTETTFDKGVLVHAAGKITYDIREYSRNYPYFIANLGVDAAKKNQGGEAKFIVAISKDNGNTWIELEKTMAVKSSENAIKLCVPVMNAHYLRITFDPHGANSYDHTVMTDAKLIKEEDIPQGMIPYSGVKHPLIYDEELSTRDFEENIADHKVDILKREAVTRLRYNIIQDFARGSSKNVEILDWLLNDEENLKLFIDSGEIKDVNVFLNSLIGLYDAYQEMPKNEDNIIYKKMAISAAVAYSSDAVASPLLYSTSGKPTYDIVERYKIMVSLYDDDKFYKKDDFKRYHMEHYRMIMADSLKNDEIVWLNEYTKNKNPQNPNDMLNPYSYMTYRYGNYGADKYYSADNKATFDAKYSLSQYGVPYGYDENRNKLSRTWITFEEGGICWNISRVGQNLHKTHGVPVVGVFQPDHEAYISLSYNAEGVGSWSIGNDIGGWGQSCSAAGGGGETYRYLFGWNNKSYTPVVHCGRGLDDAAYLILGQAVLNDLPNYELSRYYNLLANSYSDLAVREMIYKKAIEVQDINIDSYEGLIKTYELLNKSESDWNDLARKITEVYKYHLTGLNDMLRLIRPHLSAANKIEIDMVKRQIIEDAAKVKDNQMWQGRAIRQMGEFLLGKDQSSMAKFAFDGDNANVIVINRDYVGSRIQIQYSFDNFNTHKIYEIDDEAKIVLTSEDLAQINANDDIQLKISGSNSIFRIDIKEGTNIDNVKLAASDDENRFYGNITNLETSRDGINWESVTSDSLFEGDIDSLKYRYKASGTTLASAIREVSFTDNTDQTKQYVPVKHVTFVSAEAHQDKEDAEYLVDGNPFTLYHTRHNQDAKNRDYIIKFDEVKLLSGISYDPRQDGGINGTFKNVEVYVSLDKDNYKLVGSASGWESNKERKFLYFDMPMEALYVKVKVVSSHGDTPDKFISGTRLNFYEDVTVYEEPTITYSINELTNQDVEAKLVLPQGYSAECTSYIFTENGEYTFKYEDKRGISHTIVAHVDWIDKVAPTVSVETVVEDDKTYAIIVEASEEVTFKDGSTKLLLMETGTYEIEVIDKAGNSVFVEVTVKGEEVVPPVDMPSKNDFVLSVNKDKISVEYTGDKELILEYSLDGINWQESQEFMSLEEDTEYTLFVRMRIDDVEEVLTISFKTLKSPVIPSVDDIAIFEGESLSEQELPNGWKWLEDTGDLEPGVYELEVYFDDLEIGVDYSSVEGYDPINHRIVKKIVVTVKEKTPTINQAPVIVADNIEIYVGEVIDLLKGVSVTDFEDGDILISEKNIVENTVDINKPGTYRVTYEVSDSQGVVTRTTIKVTVKEKVVDNDSSSEIKPTIEPTKAPVKVESTKAPVKVESTKAPVTSTKPNNSKKPIKTNEKPVISGDDLIYCENDNINLLKGIKASDFEDGDITKSIEIINVPKDYSVGEYTISYKVVDSDGNETVFERKVKIIASKHEATPDVENPDVNLEMALKVKDITLISLMVTCGIALVGLIVLVIAAKKK